MTIPPDEPNVWSYRGYQLKPSEFNSAMIHLFRAEVMRSNVWRQRLDTTTNWAVLTTGATMSFAFGEPNSHHSVVILNTLLVTLFLCIEARRYRYYELWSLRVRLLETDFFAAMLTEPASPSTAWSERLAASLRRPEFPISFAEAIGRRFRRNYLWLYLLLALAWVIKIGIFPQEVASFDEFITRAEVGGISGWIVLAVGVVVNGIMLGIGLGTMHLDQATGEVLPRDDDMD